MNTNKCPEHLFVHFTKNLVFINRDPARLLETQRLFVSCTNGKIMVHGSGTQGN